MVDAASFRECTPPFRVRTRRAVGSVGQEQTCIGQAVAARCPDRLALTGRGAQRRRCAPLPFAPARSREQVRAHRCALTGCDGLHVERRAPERSGRRQCAVFRGPPLSGLSDNRHPNTTHPKLDPIAVTPSSTEARNAAQIEYWNASAGRTWARYHEALDRQITPLGLEAIRRLAPRAGERLLDIGCGCGQTTLELASRVGELGSVLGVDISAPMLEIATARQAHGGVGGVEFRQADAQVADLGRASFDGVFSRFGVMFFGDPVEAFCNVRRALKPGGRLAFVCWRPLDANAWMAEPLSAARAYLPPAQPTDPTAPGPFAFADATRVQGILGQAGFNAITVSRFDADIGGGTLDEALDLALRIGPLGAAIREAPELMPQVAGPVREVLSRYETPHGVLMPASVWIVTAVARDP